MRKQQDIADIESEVKQTPIYVIYKTTTCKI